MPAPKDAPPLGTSGSTDGRWYEPLRVEAYRPGQRRQITNIGSPTAQRLWFINLGLALTWGEIVGHPAGTEIPPPSCDFLKLWENAITQGAPAEAVAQITYDADGYVVNIPGVFHRRYGGDCMPLLRKRASGPALK